MTKIELELPEEAFSALRATPQEFVRQMRFAAAVHWYHQGVISGSKAAQIAGLTRLEFLDELARRRLNVLNMGIDEIKEELERG